MTPDASTLPPPQIAAEPIATIALFFEAAVVVGAMAIGLLLGARLAGVFYRQARTV